MTSNLHEAVLVAHRRAPVLRLLRTNLEAEGISVLSAATPPATLATLLSGAVRALVIDAELLRESVPGGPGLLSYLRRAGLPLLLLSWYPADRLLARSLGDARFCSRADDVDQVIGLVRDLLVTPGQVEQPAPLRRP